MQLYHGENKSRTLNETMMMST